MAKGDFRSLVSAVSEQFHEIKESLSLFPYFNTWDESSITELCRIATIQLYNPDTVILGSENENSHMVYFVLDGICEMIHYLQIVEEKKKYKNPVYKLYSSDEFNLNNSENKSVRYTSIMFNEKINWDETEEKLEIVEPEASEEKTQEEIQNGDSQAENEKEIEESEKIENEEEELEKSEHVSEKADEVEESSVRSKETPVTESEHQEPISERSEPVSEPPDQISEPQESIPESSEPISDHQESIKSGFEESGGEFEESEPVVKLQPKEPEEPSPEPQEPTPEPEEVEEKKPTYGPDHHLLVLAECIERRKRATKRATESSDVKKPENLKRIFVRTGFLTKGATFGLERSEKDMFIISATKVKCLRIPKRFLLQHDPYSTSIWDRIKLFHRLYYPKNEKVLEKVKNEWKWAKYKKDQTQRIISKQKIPNYTSIADVPVVFRLGKVPGV